MNEKNNDQISGGNEEGRSNKIIPSKTFTDLNYKKISDSQQTKDQKEQKQFSKKNTMPEINGPRKNPYKPESNPELEKIKKSTQNYQHQNLNKKTTNPSTSSSFPKRELLILSMIFGVTKVGDFLKHNKNPAEYANMISNFFRYTFYPAICQYRDSIVSALSFLANGIVSSDLFTLCLLILLLIVFTLFIRNMAFHFYELFFNQ